MENILSKIKVNQCTGCGLCEFVCPQKCINVVENKHGFFKISLNNKNCIKCGLCSNVCHTTNENKQNDFKVFGGRAKNLDILENSRSGGLFYLLSKKIIEDGGISIGAAFDNHFEVKHIAIDKVDDLWKIQGSKYAQSDFKDVFKILKEANKAGRNAIVGGTGCQIASLRSFIEFYKLDKSKIILIDIVCFGVPSRRIFRDYLNQYRKFGIIAFDFRDKSFGWGTHKESCYTRAKGRIVSKEFANAFGSKLIISDNCFNCKYKNLNRPGDITLGDFWGLEENNPSLFSKKGNSLFLINNDEGFSIFNEVKDEFYYFDVDKNSSYWLQPALTCNWEQPHEYEKFWNEYDKKSFKHISKKRFLKKPNFIVRCFRKIVRMVRG